MICIKLLLKTLISLSFVIGLIFFDLQYPQLNDQKSKQIGLTEARLISPDFLKTAFAAEECQLSQNDIDSIEQEAGMTAYAKLSKPIDIEEVRQLMDKSSSKATSTTLSGLMLIPNYELIPGEHSEVQIYIDSCGWIIAYLPRGKFAAELLDWKNYDDGRLSITTLERVIQAIIALTKGESILTGFYHFAYPDATNIVFAVEGVDRSKQNEEFQVTVPIDITIIESSIAASRYNLANNWAPSTCVLDDTIMFSQAAQEGKWIFEYQKLTETQFRRNVTHQFELKGADLHPTSKFFCGIAIVYKEAKQK